VTSPTFRSADRTSDLVDRFRARFGGTPRVYRAPGRVNLIGEHTDYNDGFVLPAALALSCWVAAALRDDGRMVVRSEDLGKEYEWDVASTDATPAHSWSDYVQGVALMFGRALGKKRDTGDQDMRGVSILIQSDVPMGAGLSSSAAIEVAVARALIDLAGAPMEPTEVARLCQRAENEFVGARCGIMDQFIACHARLGHALLLDCRSLESRPVSLPSHVRLVACNTMVRHSIASGEYNRRRAECEEGVKELARRLPGLRSLRDLDLAVLDREGRELPDTIRRRCRHVVSENARVDRAARALEEGDLEIVGALMADSHRSLRDDYEVSCAELDLMVGLARETSGVYGARMTGGGFGGCTVNLVDKHAVSEFRRHVVSGYQAKTGRAPDIYVTEAGRGAERVV